MVTSANLRKRNDKYLIQITKLESEIIRNKYPNARIIRTCVQKSKRHRYYLPEQKRYLHLLKNINREAAQLLKEMQGKQDFIF